MDFDALDWNDVKLVLAVSRSSTLAETARHLGVDPTTASRRLLTFETAAGAPLFLRSHGRLALSPAGEALVPHAMAMERAARVFGAEASAEDTGPAGEVRLSAPPSFARTVLAPAIPDFAAGRPGISISLAVGASQVRLDLFEADLAIRLALPKTGANLVVRRLGAMAYAPFAAAGRESADRWIAYDTQFSHLPEAQWVEDRLAGGAPVLRSNDPDLMAAAAAGGAGRALLPVALGSAHSDLRQDGPPVLSRDVWLLQNRDMAAASHIRTVAAWIVELARSRIDP